MIFEAITILEYSVRIIAERQVVGYLPLRLPEGRGDKVKLGVSGPLSYLTVTNRQVNDKENRLRGLT